MISANSSGARNASSTTASRPAKCASPPRSPCTLQIGSSTNLASGSSVRSRSNASRDGARCSVAWIATYDPVTPCARRRVARARRGAVDQPAQPEAGIGHLAGHGPAGDRVEHLRGDRIAHRHVFAAIEDRKSSRTAGVNATPPSHAPIAFHTTGTRSASPASAGRSQMSYGTAVPGGTAIGKYVSLRTSWPPPTSMPASPAPVSTRSATVRTAYGHPGVERALYE